MDVTAKSINEKAINVIDDCKGFFFLSFFVIHYNDHAAAAATAREDIASLRVSVYVSWLNRACCHANVHTIIIIRKSRAAGVCVWSDAVS